MEYNNQNGVLTGLEFMGDNIRKTLKYCGEGVRLYPMCKLIHGQNAILDDEVKIFDHVYIDAGENLIIGKYSIITWYTLIEGGAKAYIGDRVFIGPGTKILTGTYKINGFFTIEFMPKGCNEIEYGDVTIENDVYIGANSVIMPGVTIHEGAVVGSNCFVNKDLEPWSVYVGSPCRKVGEREKPSSDMIKRVYEEIDWTPRYK